MPGPLASVLAVVEREAVRRSTEVSRPSAGHPPHSGRQYLMRWLSIAAALAGALLIPTTAPAQERPVDLELVLAVDASYPTKSSICRYTA